MKSLGEQVQDFMEQEGLNAPAMGRLVGVSRQNIQNLMAGTVKNPAYIAELARVMRTSADVLLAGRYSYRPAGAAEPQIAPTKTPSPADPWPLDPWIPRDVWEQLGPHQRGAVAYEASKALRDMKAQVVVPAPAPVEVSSRRKSA